MTLAPPNHREVTGFASLASSYCVDMRREIECASEFKGMVSLNPSRYTDGK